MGDGCCAEAIRWGRLYCRDQVHRETRTLSLMTDPANSEFDTIIVGAGPAGLCAAMYAGRGMLRALTL